MKAYADNQKSALSPELKPGDAVLIKQPKTRKLTPDCRPHPYTVVRVTGTMVTVVRVTGTMVTVVRVTGTMVTAQRGNHWITRNISFYNKVSPELVPDDNIQSEESDDDDDDWPSKPQPHSMKPARTVVADPPAEKDKPMEEVRRRYPQRERRPTRFYIYVSHRASKRVLLPIWCVRHCLPFEPTNTNITSIMIFDTSELCNVLPKGGKML